MDTIRILGIDPALRSTGYGIIDSNGREHRAVDCGVIRTKPGRPLSECLRRINGGMAEIVKTFTPTVAAMEGGFFSKNAKTAMLLGCARGTVIAALSSHGIDVYEYAPRRVKQAISGYGNADKTQIALLMSQLFGIETEGLPSDATDALAIAICHSHTFFTNQGIFLPTPI